MSAPGAPVALLNRLATIERDLVDVSPPDPLCFAAARVLEGLRATLDGRSAAKVKDLDRAAATLLAAADLKWARRSQHASPGKPGQQAERLRAVVARRLSRGQRPGDIPLALLVLGDLVRAATNDPAPDVFPEPRDDQRLVEAIGACLGSGRSARADEKAEAIVVAVAGAAGVRRPSRLFQAEEKRTKRAARRR